MNNLKVSTRLMLGFGMLTVIGLSIAILSALRMKTLANQLDEVATDRMVKVAQFTLLKDDLGAIVRRTQSIVIVDDKAFREDEKKKIAQLRVANDTILQKLEDAVALPKAVEVLNIIRASRDEFNQLTDRVIELAEKGDKAAAGALLVGEARSIQDKYFEAVANSRDLQKKIADQLANDAMNLSSNSVTLMGGLAALMMAIGLLVNWIIIRDLAKSLGAEPSALSDVAQNVAGGDLSVHLQVRTGDTGSVMAAMARMQTALTSVVTTVRSGSEGVATASAEIAQGNTDLSSRTEEQASALEETAASMEQLSSTVKQNADSARQANQLAVSASAGAVPGGEVGGPGGRSGRSSGRHDEGDQRQFQEDCRHHQCDRRHCIPNQHPGAQRRCGSGPCGRAGTRLCRGRQRSAQPRAKKRRRCQGNQDADRQQRGAGRAWQHAGRQGWRVDDRSGRRDPARDRHHRGGQRCQRRAKPGCGAGRRGHCPDGPGHPTKCRTGGAKRRCRQQSPCAGPAVAAGGFGIQTGGGQWGFQPTTPAGRGREPAPCGVGRAGSVCDAQENDETEPLECPAEQPASASTSVPCRQGQRRRSLGKFLNLSGSCRVCHRLGWRAFSALQARLSAIPARPPWQSVPPGGSRARRETRGSSGSRAAAPCAARRLVHGPAG